MNRLSYEIGNGRKLIILKNVFEKLQRYRQIKKGKKEAGGLLIGRHLLQNEHIAIDQITEPSWRDRRLRTYFYRSGRHNRKLQKAWKISDRTQTLVGLWHTHPEPIPNPSSTDLEDWRRTITRGEFNGIYLFFLIVGTKKIRVWQGNRSAQFIELVESEINNGTRNE